MLRHCKGVLATCNPLMLMLTLAVLLRVGGAWKCCGRDREQRENPMKLKEEISEELARIESQLTRTGAGSLGGERRTPATQAQPTHVADVMNRGLVTVQPTDTVPAAARRLWQHGRTSLPVVDAQGRLVGWLAESALLARLRPHHRACGAGCSRCRRTGPTHTRSARGQPWAS